MHAYQDYEDCDSTAPYVKGSDTSEAAARSLDPLAQRECVRRILALFASGATYTRAEIVAMLDPEDYPGITARMSELFRAGILVNTGQTRLTPRGKAANVLRMIPDASMKMYEAYLKNRSKTEAPKIKYKKWLATLGAAGVVYAKSPTPDNLTALGRVAKTTPEGAVVASSTSPVEGVGFEDEEDVMDWAKRSSS